MKAATRNRLVIGASLAVALLAFNAGVDYRKTRELHESSQWVIHSHEVHDALVSLLSTLKDAETGQRGYVITGEAEYLAPYHDALARHRTAIERVAELTADDPEQQADLQRLRGLISAKLDEIEEVVSIRKAQSFDAARAMVETDYGKRSMDGIRSLVDTMQGREKSLLQARQRADNAAYRSSVAAIAVSAIAGLAVVAAFLLLLRAYIKSVVHSADRLYEQRELLRATLLSIGDGVIATDVVGNVTFLNDVAQRLTGWPETEAKGTA